MSEEKFAAQGNVASVNVTSYKEKEQGSAVGPEAIPKKKLSFSSPITFGPLIPLPAPKKKISLGY